MRRYKWAVAAVAAVALISVPAAGADTTAGTLSVEGSGSVFVAPGVADLSGLVCTSSREFAPGAVGSQPRDGCGGPRDPLRRGARERHPDRRRQRSLAYRARGLGQ